VVQQTTLLLFTLLLVFSPQNSPCPYDESTHTFSGLPVDQARCLLRRVLPGGRLASPQQKLPTPLEELIGRPVLIKRSQLQAYLLSRKITATDLGGPLIGESGGTSAAPPSLNARYFVIHDASTPNYGPSAFPADLDGATWEFNDLRKHWSTRKVAHVFINRLGQSVTAVDFASPLPAGRFGTKLARDLLGETKKDIQIHVELLQPRRSSAGGPPGNDLIAPQPGFTEAQLDRLALVYLAASLRRGEWMIPAFHAAVDDGIPDAHDDPQNFDLDRWASRLNFLLVALQRIRD
jgi:hypothetical protein